MLKTLEKYKQYVLVIGGSLLMVAFIMPSAMHQLRGDPADSVVAYVGNEKVRGAELGLAYRELIALNAIAPLLTRSAGILDRDDEHWFLLSRDAQRSGFVGGESDGELFLYGDLVEIVAYQLARQQYGQVADQIFQQPSFRTPMIEQAQKAMPNMAEHVQREARLTRSEFYTALAKLRGVLRLEQSFVQAGRLSDRRLQLASQEIRDGASVNAVVIPATRLSGEVADPTDAQLTEHFEKYKAVKPNESDNGIGYYQPERVKLAWILVDHAAIADSVKVDPVEANKRWRKDNPAKPAEEYAKDRPAIEEQIRKERVADIHAQIDKIWRAQILAATRRLSAEGEYRKLPDDWATTRPTLESIARNIVDNIQSSTGVTIPTPVIVSRDANWLTAEDVFNIPGLGQGTVTLGNNSLPAWQFIFTARELFPVAPKVPPAGVAVQAGVPVAEAHAQDNRENRFYFMVLDTRRAGPADSLADIREKVIKGYKSIEAFQILTARSPEYLKKAQDSGVEALVAEFEPAPGLEATGTDEVKLLSRTLVTGQRVWGSEPRIQNDAFRDAARAIRTRIDPTKPIEQLGALDRTFAVPLPGSLALAVGQVAAVEPLTSEDFRSFGENFVREVQVKEFEKTGKSVEEAGPFSVASLRASLNYRRIDNRATTEKPEPAAETTNTSNTTTTTTTPPATTP
jgi:hypothetical protein